MKFLIILYQQTLQIVPMDMSPPLRSYGDKKLIDFLTSLQMEQCFIDKVKLKFVSLILFYSSIDLFILYLYLK